MRSSLAKLGWDIRINESLQYPVLTLHRHDNAYILSLFSHCAIGTIKFRTQYGIPAHDSCDVKIENGFGEYNLTRFLRAECRVFVEQEAGIVTVAEDPP